jgi:hypothetical protein
MHTDGLLGGGEYRRHLWGTNMSLSDATAVCRRANLAHGTADSAAYITSCRQMAAYQSLGIEYGRNLLDEPLIVAC